MLERDRLPKNPQDPLHPVRQHAVGVLSVAEDVIYAGLGVLLALTAMALLIVALKNAVNATMAGKLDEQAVVLLDQILLVLVVVELLYTVQVSFREHGLITEPFLVVALIASIRRVLVVAAEAPHLAQANQEVFNRAMMELGVLTFMILVLVGCLIILQRKGKPMET